MELQYDGTQLHGWAKQPGLETVEGCLEKAFETVMGASPRLLVAGRTDAGVHARKQIAGLQLPRGTDLVKLTGSLNALTPKGIVVKRIARTREGFDARRDASSRVYRYFLSTTRSVSPFWAPYCWHLGHAVDSSILRATAEATLGLHDFTGFTPTVTEHTYFMRNVYRCTWAAVKGEPGMLRMEVEADAFLRHMVRTLVGTMIEVAQGRLELAGYERLLLGVGREDAGLTAPAHGLFLWDIKYKRSR